MKMSGSTPHRPCCRRRCGSWTTSDSTPGRCTRRRCPAADPGRKPREMAAISLSGNVRQLTLGIPGVQTAAIHPTSYLPLLNGRPFSTFSSGGGIITGRSGGLLDLPARGGAPARRHLLPGAADHRQPGPGTQRGRGTVGGAVPPAGHPGRRQPRARCSSSSLTISCPPATAAITPRSTSPTTHPPYRPSAGESRHGQQDHGGG